MARVKSPTVDHLHELASDRAAQGAYAASLLDGRHGKDVMMAALAVLAEYPYPPARPQILRLFTHYAADRGVRDQGAYFRRCLLDALRPIAERSDGPMLETAAATYEFWPPKFDEDAVLLRAAALLTLSQVDEELARFHAARLLVDGYVQPMSGEPAVTAARVLGAYDELTVLWSYVFSTPSPALPEVMAECLRQMLTLPESLLPVLIERFGQKAPAAVELALYQLLINHQTGPHARDFLRRRLQELRDADVYRYLVMSIVASGREPLLEDLLAQAAETQDQAQAGRTD